MATSLEEMYANLVLEDEEEEEIIVEKTDIIELKQTFVLVGRFLTEKNINFNAMRNVIASLWRPKEGIEIHDLGGWRYSFIFYHIMDLRKVVEGGPWSFEQANLVFHQLEESEDPRMVASQEMEIWVQVYDVPRGCLSENILKSVGASIGKYVKSDPANFYGAWKSYVRVRVAINVEKPLKRRMKIKREGDAWSWINFKYERLSSFCFVCGKLGHAERECSVVYAHPEKTIVRAYGSWLRAPAKNASMNMGSRWLRNVNDSSKVWDHKSFQSESSNSGHGTEEDRYTAKFMEVDGTVREINGDNDMVNVKTREIRDTNIGNQSQNQLEIISGGSVGEKQVFVLDSKRKRVEEHAHLQGETVGANDQMDTDKQQVLVSKNDQKVGSGSQAHQTL